MPNNPLFKDDDTKIFFCTFSTFTLVALTVLFANTWAKENDKKKQCDELPTHAQGCHNFMALSDSVLSSLETPYNSNVRYENYGCDSDGIPAYVARLDSSGMIKSPVLRSRIVDQPCNMSANKLGRYFPEKFNTSIYLARIKSPHDRLTNIQNGELVCVPPYPNPDRSSIEIKYFDTEEFNPQMGCQNLVLPNYSEGLELAAAVTFVFIVLLALCCRKLFNHDTMCPKKGDEYKTRGRESSPSFYFSKALGEIGALREQSGEIRKGNANANYNTLRPE